MGVWENYRDPRDLNQFSPGLREKIQDYYDTFNTKYCKGGNGLEIINGPQYLANMINAGIITDQLSEEVAIEAVTLIAPSMLQYKTRGIQLAREQLPQKRLEAETAVAVAALAKLSGGPEL
jgi:hypothetical protein